MIAAIVSSEQAETRFTMVSMRTLCHSGRLAGCAGIGWEHGRMEPAIITAAIAAIIGGLASLGGAWISSRGANRSAEVAARISLESQQAIAKQQAIDARAASLRPQRIAVHTAFRAEAKRLMSVPWEDVHGANPAKLSAHLDELLDGLRPISEKAAYQAANDLVQSIHGYLGKASKAEAPRPAEDVAWWVGQHIEQVLALSVPEARLSAYDVQARVDTGADS